jgi:predicted permease
VAVVLSHDLWMRRFAGSPRAVGEAVYVDGHAARIVGVAPPGFHGTTGGLRPEAWLPAERESSVVRSGGARGYFVVARLAAGAGLREARAALDLLSRRLERTEPDAARRFEVLPESAGHIHPLARGSFVGFSAVLVVVSGLLLVLACVNVSGLLLARSAGRRHEIGARMAVGATPGRILQQMLVEGALLALAAYVLGIALAWSATRGMSTGRLPIDWPIAFDFGLDGRVVGWGLLGALASALVVGLVPALEASRSDVLRLLRQGGPGKPPRAHAVFLSAQIALSTLLLIGGGLFLRSLEEARRADLGFDPDGLVLASVDPGLGGYTGDEARTFWRRLLERLRSLPRVDSASLASAVPLELNVTETALAPEGFAPSSAGEWPVVPFVVADAGYFETLRTPILRGREFEPRDLEPQAPDVVVANDVLARRYFPGRSAVGERVTDRSGRLFEVIGVVRHTRYLTIGGEPTPEVFFPNRPTDGRAMTVVVRGRGDPLLLLEDVRVTVRDLDERVPIFNVKTAARHVDAALAPARWGAMALSGVGLVALLLACAGLYGTMALFVTSRTREIGIRRVLGARPADVVWLLARRVVRPVAVGLVAGVAAGLAGSRALAGQLHGVHTADPVAFVLAPLVLLVASLVAVFWPARRAVRLEPARALREE